MKQNHKLLMTYQKFGSTEGYTIAIAPYTIKVFKHRWYMLVKNDKRPVPSVYALDHIVTLEETSESFDYPSDFDSELFFKDYNAVLCKTDSQAEQIIIRAYPPFTHYLRTLPLHHSQKELRTTPDYVDFAFHLHPPYLRLPAGTALARTRSGATRARAAGNEDTAGESYGAVW